jgi:hypothetical protein
LIIVFGYGGKGDKGQLRDLQSIWKPINAYETLCVVAAGCNSDDAFDHCCSQILGMQKYKEYCAASGKLRFGQDT